MNTLDPIGIFDSGVGGTSIWKEIHQLLPYENTIYLADSEYAPYGNKIIFICMEKRRSDKRLDFQSNRKIEFWYPEDLLLWCSR